MRTRPVAVAATCGGLLCALLALGIWLRLPAVPPQGFSWALPIAPGRQLTFALWTHDLAFSPAYTTGGLTRQRPGPLRLTISFQHRAGSFRQQLAVLKIPAWPLLVGAVLLAVTARWLWVPRRDLDARLSA
jgi:hypothetical protein